MADSPDTPKLTPKQQRFVDYYCGADDGVALLNATQAYIKAGYSNKDAHKNASRLIRENTSIRAHIDALFADQALSRNETLALVAKTVKQSDADILSVAAGLGPASAASYISSKISERNAQTSNVLKAHGVFTENIHHTGGIDIQIVGVDTEQL